MIWYLLYPFRGTTEPPVLSPNHPIRSILRKHGTSVARHWLTWILACVALAVLVCYPSFYLYADPSTGFSKLPHHVWTSAKRFTSVPDAHPDVEIRQVWIHGSYMKALNQSVLKEALRIQDTILGEKTGCLLPLSNDTKGKDGGASTLEDLTWAFHSPLLLWNCSYDLIDQDENLVATVNNQSSRKSPFGFTLRPTSVFAMKLFENNKLKAADALVITLFDRVEPSGSQNWNSRFAALAEDAPGRWSIYPPNPRRLHHELYQFQYKPMSLQDDFILFIAYAAMIAYVLVSVRRLRAFKSKFGLVVAVFVQIGISILASFSLCGALKIDLAVIPQEIYPFVVLVIGLENMFRLVNALLAYPPQTPTIARISSALSDVGHLALASAGQNLFILWLLAKAVSPGVASFCAFAAVAIVVDFFFHLTFFLAVLTIDVRRMELQDSIDRRHSSRRNSRTPKPGRRYWVDAMVRGRLPISSRLAGSAISICFILILNVHFFDNESTLRALTDSFKAIFASCKNQAPEKGAQFSTPPSINQARTPQAWLRIQDYNMAQEIIKFIKPDAHTITARVYDPLNIVLARSDRTGVPRDSTPFISSFLRLVHQHLYPLLLVVIIAVAFVTLLMQYLLFNELLEEDMDLATAETTLTVKSLPQAHRLDIVKLETCSKGHFITIGLDRVTAISLLDPVTGSYSLSGINMGQMTSPFWPITAVAIDENGLWAALLTENEKILFWNLPERRVSHFHDVKFDRLDPLLFAFVMMERADGNEALSLLVVLPNQRVIELDVHVGKTIEEFSLGPDWLLAAAVFRSGQNVKVIAATQKGRIAVATYIRKAWDQNWKGDHFETHVETRCWDLSCREDNQALTKTGEVEGDYNSDPRNSRVKSIVVAQELGLAVIARRHRLDLFDIRSQTFVKFIDTFDTGIDHCSKVRVLHSPRRQCPTCQGVAVHSISFVYNDNLDNTATSPYVMRTFAIGVDYNSLICLSHVLPGKPNNCKGILDANESFYRIENPGSWEATGTQAVIGIRRVSIMPSSRDGVASGNDVSADGNTAKPRRRKASFLNGHHSFSVQNATAHAKPEYDGVDEWEVWTLTTAGNFSTVPLHAAGDISNNEVDRELFVAEPGPIKKLGKRSVALAFGNTIKVITLGNERFEEDVDEYVDPAQQMNTARRRRLAARRTEALSFSQVINKATD